MRRGVVWPLLALVMSASLTLGALSLRQKSPTYDERHFYGLGMHILRTGSWEEEGALMHPPLAYYLHTPPLMLHDDEGPFWNLNRARACILVLTVVPLILTCFWWARSLYGAGAGLLAGGLVALEPNILAHARLVTTDAVLTCWWTASFALWWAYLATGGSKRLFLGASMALGLALMSKYSALLAVLLWLPLALLVGRRASKAALVSIGSIACALVVLAVGYGFRHVPSSLSDFEPLSRLFESAGEVEWLSSTPLPFPREYLRGVDCAQHVSENGWPAFLMGDHSQHGWWYYFLVAAAIKTPLALFGLLLLRVGTRIRRDDLFLLLPTFAFLGYMSFLAKVNIGLRHVLPVYPLLIVFASGCVAGAARWKKVMVVCLAAWFAVASISIYPHYLAYFNELIGGPRNGYKYLVDSNLDWGQDLDRAISYVDHSRGPVRLNPGCSPVEGLVLVGANELQGILGEDGSCYKWLRELRPVGHVGYSHILFRVPPETVRQWKESQQGSGRAEEDASDPSA